MNRSVRTTVTCLLQPGLILLSIWPTSFTSAFPNHSPAYHFSVHSFCFSPSRSWRTFPSLTSFLDHFFHSLSCSPCLMHFPCYMSCLPICPSKPGAQGEEGTPPAETFSTHSHMGSLHTAPSYLPALADTLFHPSSDAHQETEPSFLQLTSCLSHSKDPFWPDLPSSDLIHI